MTSYLEDSFGLYVIFFQGEKYQKSFVVESFFSWRYDYTLKDKLVENEKKYVLDLTPKLLLKINIEDEGKFHYNDLIRNFETVALKDYAVSRHLYFLDQQILKEKISIFFNASKLTYISVWGEWEHIISVSQ